MKIYSWNSQQISINDNGQIKNISPFFLVSDDKAYLFYSDNYTDLGDIFNIEEIKNISLNIQKLVNNIKNEMVEKINHISQVENKLDNALNEINNLMIDLKQIKAIKIKQEEIKNNIDEKYNMIQTEINKHIEKIENFQKITDEKIKEANFAFNKASVNISDLIDQAENKTVAKYMATRINMDNIYNKYINQIVNKMSECKKYAEISKKWACNPINMPVENTDYSAKHYAVIVKNQAVQNG